MVGSVLLMSSEGPISLKKLAMTWEKEKKILTCVLITAIILVIIATAIIFKLITVKNNSQQTEIETKQEIQREVWIDTIPYYQPIAKDSTVIRWDTITIPTSQNSRDTIYIAQNDIDSVSFAIPITQKIYEEEQYTAYVSGYEPALDSIFVYPRTEVITVKETETVTVKSNPKRWGLGIQAGIGVNPDLKISPYLGVGFSYNILTW